MDVMIYDLQKHSESKPNLVFIEVGDLPEKVFIGSIGVVCKPSLTTSSSTNCMHEKGSEIQVACK